MCMRQWCRTWSMKIIENRRSKHRVTTVWHWTFRQLPLRNRDRSRPKHHQRQAVDSQSLWPHIPAYQLIQCKNVTKSSTYSPVEGVERFYPSLSFSQHTTTISARPPAHRWSSESPIHIILDSWNFRLELSPGYDTSSSVTFQRQHVVWQDLCKETRCCPHGRGIGIEPIHFQRCLL